MAKTKSEPTPKSTPTANFAPEPEVQPAPKKKPNTILWRVLILPSILILAIAVGLYELVPWRDAFLRGDASGSYLLLGTYAALSPKLWFAGLSCILFALMFLIALIRTVARGEWRYWQRLIGLIALTAAGVLLLLTNFPQIGRDARDAGSATLAGHTYHLLVQSATTLPSTNLHFMMFQCDAQGLTCQLASASDAQFAAGERVPPLETLQVNVDGNFLIVKGNSPTPYIQYRAQ
jgi:hypothetical protein